MPTEVKPTRTDEFISIAEATKRGYGSRTTLYRKIGTGRVTAIKRGRKRLISVSDLDNYLSDEQIAYNKNLYRTVAQAPALSEEQRSKLVSILSHGTGA